MAFRRRLARFNRVVSNRVIRLAAGWVPPMAIVRHQGRVSGREYRTPVTAFRVGDRLIVGLFYGPESDWAKNVVAAGRAEVERGGVRQLYPQVDRVSGDDVLPRLPPTVRWIYRLFGVRDFVQLSA